MTDIKTPEGRSRNMAAIKSKNNIPETYIRKQLFKKGYRYRINAKYIKGTPDIWMKKYRTAIFVNGCFWHRHSNCKYAYIPKSNAEFWNNKFQKNVERDQIVYQRLHDKNIKVLIIWECTIKKMMKNDQQNNSALMKIDEFLKNDKLKLEL